MNSWRTASEHLRLLSKRLLLLQIHSRGRTIKISPRNDTPQCDENAKRNRATQIFQTTLKLWELHRGLDYCH